MKKVFFIAALGVASIMSANNTVEKNELKFHSTTRVVDMTCTVTITVRNSAGLIIAQWNEYYTVKDWDFAGCNKKGEDRVKELSGSLK